MLAPDSRQAILDEEHLRLLVIVHYIRAATTALFACLPLVHVAMGLVLIAVSIFSSASSPANSPPAFIGFFFVGIGMAVILLGWTFAALQWLVGRSLARRRHRTFCFVMSALNCVGIPYGTAIGVMTMVVLSRKSVQAQFDSQPRVGA